MVRIGAKYGEGTGGRWSGSLETPEAAPRGLWVFGLKCVADRVRSFAERMTGAASRMTLQEQNPLPNHLSCGYVR
jgi:hypothetical protein